MKNKIKYFLLVASFSFCAYIMPSVTNAGALNFNGQTNTFELSITLLGDDLTIMNKMQAMESIAEMVWNNGFASESSCHNIKLDITIDSESGYDNLQTDPDKKSQENSSIMGDYLEDNNLDNPDTTYVYLYDTEPGVYFRSFVQFKEQFNSYTNKSYGVWRSGGFNTGGTYAHEIGHLLGMEDHYEDVEVDGKTLSKTEPGWEDNIMADSNGRYNFEAGEGFKPENFEEVWDNFKKYNEDKKVNSCLILFKQMNEGKTEFTHIDSHHVYTFTLQEDIKVSPDTIVVEKEDRSGTLSGEGTGEAIWTLQQKDNLFPGYVTQNNPFPVKTSGDITADGKYNVSMTAEDQTKNFMVEQIIGHKHQYIYTTSCPEMQGSLNAIILDADNLQKNRSCSTTLEYSQSTGDGGITTWSGNGYIKVKSKQ